MPAFFIIIPLLAIAIFGIAIFASVTASANGIDWGFGKVFPYAISSFVIVTLIVTALFSIHIVDAKEIGVIKTFGKITGQTECTSDAKTGLQRCGGLTVTAPWATLSTWNIRETYVFADGIKCKNGADRCLNAADKDQQDVYIQPKVNIMVTPENVQRLAGTVGANYVDRIVRPIMITTIKKVTSEYTATDIHLKRGEVEAEVQKRLQTEFTPYSIQVTRVSFEDVNFSDSYNAAIELKSQQIQKALEEGNKLAVEKAITEQEKEKATRAAEVNRLTAEGIADANREIAASITPELIQWESIQKLNPNVEVMTIPSGTTPLFQLPSSTR